MAADLVISAVVLEAFMPSFLFQPTNAFASIPVHYIALIVQHQA